MPDKRLLSLAASLLVPLACVAQVGLPDKGWSADIYMLASGMSGNATERSIAAPARSGWPPPRRPGDPQPLQHRRSRVARL